MNEMKCPRCGGSCRFLSMYGVFECQHCKTMHRPKYDGNISDVIMQLNRYGETCWQGKMDSESRVPKSLLLRAAELLGQMEGRVFGDAALCEECLSETCALNPNGICMVPVLYGRRANMDDDGCHDWLAKSD